MRACDSESVGEVVNHELVMLEPDVETRPWVEQLRVDDPAEDESW